jgi:hypothetical protein
MLSPSTIFTHFHLLHSLSPLHFFFFFLVVVLKFELRASHLLSRYSTTWVTPPALFCASYFWDRVSQTICLGWLQTKILLISASWVARIISVSHGHLAICFCGFYFIYLFFETGSHYAAQASLKLLILLSPECWDYNTSMYHHAWYVFFFF